MDKLALLGGPPAVRDELLPYNSIGPEEIAAVERVMRSGVLSKFVGAWCEDFFGGPFVKQLELDWSRFFNVRHSISVNSATSGLFAALGAVGVGPGDEVIVPPYTMSATAMAPLVYGGIPVFADIDEETFCLTPQTVLNNITPRTKAILAVNLFGHPAPLKELRTLADARGIKLIEDNAQGPLAREHGKFAGTVGHIGVFSLNYHKHIHTGEGGICVTDDDELATRLQMIRNHGENLIEALDISDVTNMIGFNYRLTELSAAVGVEQLKKIEYHVAKRLKVAATLSNALNDLDGIAVPVVRPDCQHSYYVWAVRLQQKIVGVSRQQFSAALTAEGFPNSVGYVRPLYLLPAFQKRIAIGKEGFPFTLTNRKYEAGMCPVTERMHNEELLSFEICSNEITDSQLEQLINAFRKVYDNRAELVAKHADEHLGGKIGSSRS